MLHVLSLLNFSVNLNQMAKLQSCIYIFSSFGILMAFTLFRLSYMKPHLNLLLKMKLMKFVFISEIHLFIIIYLYNNNNQFYLSQIAADGRPAKLEKADILELTVQHLQQLHRQCDIAKSETEKENEINSTHSKSSLNTNNIKNSNINPIMERLTVTTAHQNTNNINKTYHLKVRIPNGITLLPTKLSNGDFAFILPAEISQEIFRQCCGDLQPTKNHSVQTNEQIWRPWQITQVMIIYMCCT